MRDVVNIWFEHSLQITYVAIYDVYFMIYNSRQVQRREFNEFGMRVFFVIYWWWGRIFFFFFESLILVHECFWRKLSKNWKSLKESSPKNSRRDKNFINSKTFSLIKVNVLSVFRQIFVAFNFFNLLLIFSVFCHPNSSILNLQLHGHLKTSCIS